MKIAPDEIRGKGAQKCPAVLEGRHESSPGAPDPNSETCDDTPPRKKNPPNLRQFCRSLTPKIAQSCKSHFSKPMRPEAAQAAATAKYEP